MSGCQGFLSYLLSYPNHGVGGTNVLGIGRVVSDNGYLIKDVYIRIKIKLKTSFFTSDCYKDPGQSVEYWCLESRLAFPWSSWSTCCGSSGALIVNCSLNTNLTSLLLKNNFRLIVCLLFNFTAWFLW